MTLIIMDKFFVENSLTERIRQLMEQLGMNKKTFSEKIGENPSKISHIFMGRNNPSLDMLQKILRAFPDVSTDWLIMGRGESLLNNERQKIDDHELSGLENKNDKQEQKQEDNDENSVNAKENKASIAAANNLRIKKIIILYEDGSFEER